MSDILTVASVHMHSRTAKKDTNAKKEVYDGFWDLLAQYIVRFGVRLMGGDFYMSLFCVVPQLRARGFQINLAAFYPFWMEAQDEMYTDSCGVFLIGPWEGVRLCYDCSVFDLPPPTRTTNNSMVMEQVKNVADNSIDKRQYEHHIITHLCHLF